MLNKNLRIALIPARGESKRLPNKNIIDLNGKPLIAYSIDFALKSNIIDEVWVSTDSEVIADVAKSCGAKVVKRPEKLAGDYTSTSEVIKYHTQKFIREKKSVEWIFLLQPTNPIRPYNLASEAFEMLTSEEKKALACFSPLNKKFGKISENKFYPENYSFGQRSQEIENRYYENGLLYIINIELAKNGELFPEELFPYVIDSIHGTVDIDEEEDLEYAKIILELLKK